MIDRKALRFFLTYTRPQMKQDCAAS